MQPIRVSDQTEAISCAVSRPLAGGKWIRRFFGVLIGAVAALSMCGWPATPVSAQDAASKANPPVGAEFREPVTLASKDGVLEVRLTARQGAGHARYGGDSGQELPAVRLSGDPRHGVRRADVGRQSLSGADLAGVSRRDADRPPGKRPVRPDDPGLLQSAIHAEGRAGSDLPGADDLIAVEPSRSRPPRQSEGQCRQRPAAHPSRHVEHLHLRYSRRTCRRERIGITATCTASPRRKSIRASSACSSIGRTDGNLPLVTQNSIPDPEHAAAIQFRLRSRRRSGAAQQSELAAIRQLDNAAARRRAGEGHLSSAA